LVSKLGLGGAALGGQYGEMTQEQVNTLVREALDSGVNLIDTAPYYGVTRSETVLGEALRGIPRDRYILATKCGRYDYDVFDFSAGRVMQSVDESLARLGVDVIDIYQVHDIEFGSLEQVVEETLPALEKMRRAGKIRFLGVTGLPLKIFEYVIPRHAIDTIISYARYTLFNRSLERLFPMLVRHEVGLMNASPVGLGMLSPQGPQAWHPAPEELKRFVKGVVEKWAERGVSLAKLSLQQSMACEQIPSTIGGMATVEELRSAVAAAEEPLDRELLAAVREDFREVQDQFWTQGRLENN
jgi:L-galactose dehydrogenase